MNAVKENTVFTTQPAIRLFKSLASEASVMRRSVSLRLRLNGLVMGASSTQLRWK